MGVPQEEVAGGGEGNDETGAQVLSRCAAEKLDARLGGGPGELNEELAPTAKQSGTSPSSWRTGCRVESSPHEGRG